MSLNTNNKEFYSLEDISTLTGINIQKIRDFVKGGVLQATKIGRAYYVSKQNYKRFLKDISSNADFGNIDKIRIYAYQKGYTKNAR